MVVNTSSARTHSFEERGRGEADPRAGISHSDWRISDPKYDRHSQNDKG